MYVVQGFSRKDGRGWAITATCDAAGRPTGEQYRDGTRVTMLFDAAGQMLSAQEAGGNWSRTYDGAGRLQTEAGPTHPNGQPLTHVWEATGNRTVLETWFGRHTFGYDGRGAVTAYADPEGGLATAVYDPAGRKASRVLPDGSAVTMAYDAASQLIGVRNRDAGGATLDQALLAYDAVGNPVLKVTEDGRHTMTYDALNQLLSEEHPISGAKTYDGITESPAQFKRDDRTYAGGLPSVPCSEYKPLEMEPNSKERDTSITVNWNCCPGGKDRETKLTLYSVAKGDYVKCCRK